MLASRCSNLAVGLLLLAAPAFAAEAPELPTFGQPEDKIVVTAVELKFPKKSADRAEGGPNHILFSMWLPHEHPTVRGIYLMPFNLDAVEKEQSRAMARHWGFALVGSNFMRVNKADFGPAMLTGLRDLAKQSGRREIEHAPLIMASMSAGASMCVTLAEQLPERTIACGLACLEVGPETERTRAVPMLTIFGERDGKQMIQLGELLPKRRSEFDAPWGTAPQWGRKHEWAQSNNLLWPFFDAVIRQRLPADASPLDGPVALRPCEPAGAWLADPMTWKARQATISPVGDYAGESTKACWLPDETTARVWQAFVVHQPRLKITSPLPQGDGRPLTVYAPHDEIIVRVECAAEFNGQQLALFDGANPLTEVEIADGKCELKVGKLATGIHTFIARSAAADGQSELSRPVTVLVADPNLP